MLGTMKWSMALRKIYCLLKQPSQKPASPSSIIFVILSLLLQIVHLQQNNNISKCSHILNLCGVINSHKLKIAVYANVLKYIAVGISWHLLIYVLSTNLYSNFIYCTCTKFIKILLHSTLC